MVNEGKNPAGPEAPTPDYSATFERVCAQLAARVEGRGRATCMHTQDLPHAAPDAEEPGLIAALLLIFSALSAADQRMTVDRLAAHMKPWGAGPRGE